MGILTSYPDDASTTDGDKFVTVNTDGATVLTPVTSVNKYLGPSWTFAIDTWSFASYGSRVGVINTTAGATARYSIGMWVRFQQPTLGTKYGRIIAMTSSTITVRFAIGSQLDNEAITSPFYSSARSPYGTNGNGMISMVEMYAPYHFQHTVAQTLPQVQPP